MVFQTTHFPCLLCRATFKGFIKPFGVIGAKGVDGAINVRAAGMTMRDTSGDSTLDVTAVSTIMLLSPSIGPNAMRWLPSQATAALSTIDDGAGHARGYRTGKGCIDLSSRLTPSRAGSNPHRAAWHCNDRHRGCGVHEGPRPSPRPGAARRWLSRRSKRVGESRITL